MVVSKAKSACSKEDNRPCVELLFNGRKEGRKEEEEEEGATKLKAEEPCSGSRRRCTAKASTTIAIAVLMREGVIEAQTS